MKRITALFLAAALAVSVAACGGRGAVPAGNHKEQEAVHLSVLGVNTKYSRTFLKAVQEKFPDIVLDVEYYAATNNPSGYIVRQLTSGNAPDLLYLGNNLTAGEQEAYLLDLSAYDFSRNYNLSLINQRDINGSLYMLPGNYSVFCILYNKTLFAEHGWEVPTTNQELVELARRIRQETDLIPMAHAGVTSGTYWRFLGALAQCGFLGTQAGHQWQEQYVSGNASFEDGFGEALDQLQEWIDADMFDVADAEAVNRTVYEELVNREAAMAFPVGGLLNLHSLLEDCPDEIGGFPYVGESGKDQLLNLSMNFHMGLSKRLGEEGNERKLAAALEILEYLSGEEGQAALAVSPADMSPLAGSVPSEEFPPYGDICELINSGAIVPFLGAGYWDVLAEGGLMIKDAMFYGGSLEGLGERMDELHRAALENDQGMSHVAHVEQDFSHEQTVQLMADLMLQEGGDVAVVSDGVFSGNVANSGGVSGRLFAGELDMVNYDMNIPGTFNKNLMELELSGEELFALLEQGRVLSYEGESAVFDYYWSGMDVVMEDGKIRSATLADGAPVEPEGSYRVLMGATDYDEEICPDARDTGKLVRTVYLEHMKGQTLSVPKKLCR